MDDTVNGARPDLLEKCLNDALRHFEESIDAEWHGKIHALSGKMRSEQTG